MMIDLGFILIRVLLMFLMTRSDLSKNRISISNLLFLISNCFYNINDTSIDFNNIIINFYRCLFE